ncbi:MAG: glycosyltransferase family 2 protein [Chloroflexi bacterium]|nr:MAG: glycosyltransferase family 2 protein [Chloroflexota bacterium]
MLDLAVVIVTWNVRELVLNALKTLYDDLEQSGLSHIVYVVDSASSDDTPQAIADTFPQVKLYASEKNLGFAGGNNLALREMGFGKDVPEDQLPRAVYLLNPDTLTHPGATRTLYDTLFMANDIGNVGAQLFYEDGSFQHGAFEFPGLRQLWVEFFPTSGRLIEGRFNGRYPRRLYDLGVPFEVDFTLGATMMLRREVIQQTGMFDESFFMYCEEIDWQWRMRKAGWRIFCVPQAHITHLAGKSTSQVRPQSIINLWTSRLYLFEKHYPAWKRFAAHNMLRLGIKRKLRQLEADTSLTTKERRALIDAYNSILQMI